MVRLSSPSSGGTSRDVLPHVVLRIVSPMRQAGTPDVPSVKLSRRASAGALDGATLEHPATPLGNAAEITEQLPDLRRRRGHGLAHLHFRHWSPLLGP